uniref:sigma-54-dependent transcriptional regulator n=1 Tax=Brucella anthropi TaxID=529 RepID=UPI00056A5961
DGGTLFLDGGGALPRHTQIKLFAAMQSGQFEAGGGGERTLSNARIMASNSRPLADLVHMGRFHAGLYHLLGSFAIAMPSLRNRLEDIPILLHQFMMRYVSEERMGHITGITTHALEKLKTYHWPGNVRELKNAVYRAVLLCETGELTAADFAQIGAGAEAARAVQQSVRFNLVDHDPTVSGQSGLFSGIDGAGEVRTLAAAEEEMIRFAIAHYDGQISEVARRLGIGRTTLYRKLKEYGIDVTSISGKGPGADEEGETTPFNRAAS